MAERKIGRVIYWKNLSPILALFRLMPQEGTKFPDYKPGQYIALRRDDCKLTRKINVEGLTRIVPDLNEQGDQKIGPVTHSYSISSAPYETVDNLYLEFYVVLEKSEEGFPGRLTESLFHINPESDNQITYVDRITGDFTLDKRVGEAENVILVGTGTGLAPFAAMIKQLHHDAMEGNKDGRRYTLLHTNRTFEELAYHQELLEIEAAKSFDFVYLPSVSRPTERDRQDPHIGIGRANNVLRHIFSMPLKEEADLQLAQTNQGDVAAAEAVLKKTTRPELPKAFTLDTIHTRLTSRQTVLLTCGNPNSMADIRVAADTNQIRFEKEDW
jgi:ferredoxin-NADP reductase